MHRTSASLLTVTAGMPRTSSWRRLSLAEITS
jgi:hypothetical protein